MNEKLNDWAKETLSIYQGIIKSIGESKAKSFYGQSNLRNATDCKLIIVGINPGDGCDYEAWEDRDKVNAEYVLQGNPCFHGKNAEEILYILSKKPIPEKKCCGWPLYNRMHAILSYGNKQKLLEDLSQFALVNLTMFGTLHEKDIPKGVDLSECSKSTFKLFDILPHKVIVLLGEKASKEFEIISKVSFDTIVDGCIRYAEYGQRHVLAIHHTAYCYSYEEMELVGKIISFALDNTTLTKETISSLFEKEIVAYKNKKSNSNHTNIGNKTKLDYSEIQRHILKKFDACKYDNGKRLRLDDDAKYGITMDKQDICVRQAYEGKFSTPTISPTDAIITEALSKRGYSPRQAWLGTRKYSSFGETEEEIIANIEKEIKNLFALFG